MSRHALALFFGCLTATTASAIDLVKYPKAFTTSDGAEIVLVPTSEGDQALLQVTGINHPLDGVVFLSDIVSRGGDTKAYQFQRDGEYLALVLRQKGWRGEYFEAFLPDQGRVSLYPDEDLQNEVDLQSLQVLYHQQMEEGIQAEIARFDRDGNEEEAEHILEEMDSDANTSCDSDIITEVDWDTVSDDLMIAINVSGYCGVVVTELESMCKDSDDAFKNMVQQIETVTCQFGDRLKLEMDGDEVVFTTNKDEPRQRNFANAYFRNL
ncbi:hypothetical protein [Marinobacter xestospongiae]|uniref:Uncharacterized protein n=1 Tax=Marinobacter xestospongiae TaxID=994319 RepID=A0ABU3VUM6_9GAMM|nr:hypothetical protein [Marinobacter xestospongiae]MDV2077973.1 hypothetical protein [Marinobacter xestospongiae]